MPYITKNLRDQLDPVIDELINKVNEIHSENPENTRDGLLNYAITTILNGTYPQTRYHQLNEVIGMLECCKQEYYRKRIAPYEDIKEEENGAVRVWEEKKTLKY